MFWERVAKFENGRLALQVLEAVNKVQLLEQTNGPRVLSYAKVYYPPLKDLIDNLCRLR